MEKLGQNGAPLQKYRQDLEKGVCVNEEKDGTWKPPRANPVGGRREIDSILQLNDKEHTNPSVQKSPTLSAALTPRRRAGESHGIGKSVADQAEPVHPFANPGRRVAVHML